MRGPVRRTNLFLIELIANLFVFALCAAVCVGLLVHARGMSRESGELTGAVYVAQSAAEYYKAGGIERNDIPDSADCVAFIPILQTFDRDWNVVQGGTPAFTLSVIESPEGDLPGAKITVARMDGTEIYTLVVSAEVSAK